MKVIKDLILALVNATLILVALCLFLLWQVSESGERVAAAFAENLQILRPLRQDLQGVRDELAGIRSDIQALGGDAGATANDRLARLQTRMTAAGQRLDDAEATLARLADVPRTLMQSAVDRSVDRLADELYGLRGCTRPVPQ